MLKKTTNFDKILIEEKKKSFVKGAREMEHGEVKVHVEMKPGDNIPVGAIARLLDKPNPSMIGCPDYDHATAKVLLAGVAGKNKVLEIKFTYLS